jgi:hypothetical protein
MLGLPEPVVEFFERLTLVLVIISVGIDTLRTLRLVEAKIARRAKLKSGGEERQIRAAETQYSVMHRMLNVLVILATVGAALTVIRSSPYIRRQSPDFGWNPRTGGGDCGSANTPECLRRSATSDY